MKRPDETDGLEAPIAFLEAQDLGLGAIMALQQALFSGCTEDAPGQSELGWRKA